MKVSVSWLKELVDLDLSLDELAKLLPLRTIGVKESNSEYIELDMKGYNRADLLSMRGVGYEVAAITKGQVKFSEPSDEDLIWNENTYPGESVSVEDKALCPLYCLVKIEGLKVGKPAEDWVGKLEECGMRSVDNLTDVTNLVMLEYGQPLHAFDSDKIEGGIIVRQARDGEEVETLDGKKRILQRGDLVIADKQKVTGLAGVMGAKNSEVDAKTSTILLEAAIFDPKTLRASANRLGIQSEASKRFYHGLTKRRLRQALDRAIRMYVDLGGQVSGFIINGDTIDSDEEIFVAQGKIDSLIGVNIEKGFIEEALSRLNFKLSREGDGWKVIPPYWRKDVIIKEDIVEEVARLFGYEKIPAKALQGELPDKIDQSGFELIDKIKHALVKLGLVEVQTYSFYSTQVLRNLDVVVDNLVKVVNPISSETEYLRDHLWPNLLEVIDKNWRQGWKDMAIFEVGKVYSKIGSEIQEEYVLSIAMCNESVNPLKELNQIISHFFKDLDIDISSQLDMDSLFHPVRQMVIKSKGSIVGQIGEVHKRLLDRFGVKARVAVVEVRGIL